MANLNFNKVILAGRLTADPELKTTANGTSVTSFSIAVSRRAAKAGEERKTDFINCVAWRSQAEFVSKYFRKGSSICIVGSLNQNSWTDQQGQKRNTYEVVIDEVNFVDSASESRAQGGADQGYNPYSEDRTPEYSSKTDDGPKFEQMVDDDDLPF